MRELAKDFVRPLFFKLHRRAAVGCAAAILSGRVTAALRADAGVFVPTLDECRLVWLTLACP